MRTYQHTNTYKEGEKGGKRDEGCVRGIEKKKKKKNNRQKDMYIKEKRKELQKDNKSANQNIITITIQISTQNK